MKEREQQIIESLMDDGDANDDTAYLSVDSENLVLTTDVMVEGTHFRLDWSTPEDVAHKAWHCNLSDLCASAATPAWALLQIGLPDTTGDEWWQRFANELRRQLRAGGCRLVGGDTFQSPQVFVGITLAGRPLRQGGLPRSHGQAGDSLFITGHLGGSRAGYRCLMGEASFPEAIVDGCTRRHRRPCARFDILDYIAADSRIRAAIDVSDGLLIDATRLAIASELRLEIREAALPIHRDWVKYVDVEDAWLSGEELEILFLADTDASFDYATKIGVARKHAQSDVVAIDKSGNPRADLQDLMKRSFRHFEI